MFTFHLERSIVPIALVSAALLTACGILDQQGSRPADRAPGTTPVGGETRRAPDAKATQSPSPIPTSTPTPKTTTVVNGSLKITGKIAPCSFFLPGNCSGESDFSNLPAPDDFQLVFDNPPRELLSGTVVFKVHSRWHYTSTKNDCSSKHDSDGKIEFLGKVLQGEAGYVTFTGATTWDQPFTAEGNCPKGSMSMAPQMVSSFEDTFKLDNLAFLYR